MANLATTRNGLKVLVASSEPQLCGEAASLLQGEFPQWKVETVSGALGSPDASIVRAWDLVIWDVELGSCKCPGRGNGSGCVVVAWSAPGEAASMKEALNAGARGPLVRDDGWQEYFAAAVGALVECDGDKLAPKHELLDVVAALATNIHMHEVLRMIADLALEQVDGACCCIHTFDDESQSFERTCTAARDGCSLAAGPDGGQELRLAREALDAGDLVVGACADGIPSTAAVVPIAVGGRAIGVLSARKASAGDFSHDDTMSLRLLAALAAAAIHHERVHEVARRRAQHMEVVAQQAWQEEARARALLEIATAVTEKNQLQEILAAVTRSACTAIGFERARIYLADRDSRELTVQLEARANSEPAVVEEAPIPLAGSVDSPVSRAALSTEDYTITPVAEPGEPAYERLYVRLVTQNELVGLIVADNPDSARPVSPQRTRLLHSLASLASVAIERARVDRLRSMLISSVSHELRAPLASIRAYNELVMGGDVGEINDEQYLFLSRVDRASKRLERVIADLMNLSKLRAGEVRIDPVPTDLRTLAEAIMDTMTPKAREANIELHFEQIGDVPLAMTDAGRLEQVLNNLVDNAIKFNDPGGWVRLTMRTEGAEVLIDVSDNGPGVPASHQMLIFEEFHHGTDDRSRAKEGAGLGLAIASRVMQVLGGKLWLDSEVGGGSTFHVSLPLGTAAVQAGK